MDLGTENFLLIVSIEAIALCLFAIALLFLKNRKLRRLLTKLQNKIKELRSQPAQPQQTAPAAPTTTYNDYLDAHIEITKDHHYDLGCRQDIALDLDPDAPLSRRAAALRHAVLIAEKEATASGDNTVNWDFLATRYQQLLSFTEDYTEPSNTSDDELEQTKEELAQARKRINNLEKFKNLYFELEEKWEKCKGEASEHYSELKTLAAQTDQEDSFTTIIESYHKVYNDVGSMIEHGAAEGLKKEDIENHKTYIELQQLRTVAADQHRIITELKDKLEQSDSTEEQIEVVESLQTELQKQARFLQESETCIQLMEDELESVNNEVVQLRKKLNQLPELKAILKDLQATADHNDQTIDSLKTENRRLAKKLKLTQEAPPEENDASRKLRKELTTMQAKYNDLEEKFLNLKLQE